MKRCFAVPKCILPILGVLGLVLASTICSPAIIAQEAASASQEPIKQADRAGLPPLPPSPIEKAQKDGTALPLSLKDVTKLALQNNLDIAISDTNEQASQQKIIGSYGNYDPKVTAQLGVNSSKSANTTQYDLSTESYMKSDNAQWNFTFRQPVITGGTLQAQWNSNRRGSNSNTAVFNPSYGSSMTVQFTQPLWRNLRIDEARKTIKVTKLDLQNSDSQFKQKVTETISAIQGYYWDLVSAVEDYDIKRGSVELAQITLRDNKKKVEVGTLAPIQITEAEAELANRELQLTTSEETIIRQENNLRRYITSDRSAEIWSKIIVPTDKPDFVEYRVDLETAIDTALRNRPELEQSDITLKKADLELTAIRNSRKWQFDLTGAFGSSGTAGPQGCQRNNFTGECVLGQDGLPIMLTPPALVGGLGTSYKTIFTEGFTNWQVAFQVEIPLRSRSLDSQLAVQEITKRQYLIQRKTQEQSIQVEIRNAFQRLETMRKQVATAKKSRELSLEQLEGEKKRFDAGLSENFRVLDRQNQYASAQFQELSSLISYKKAIIDMQKSMYTLLESNDFEIAKGMSQNVPSLK